MVGLKEKNNLQITLTISVVLLFFGTVFGILSLAQSCCLPTVGLAGSGWVVLRALEQGSHVQVFGPAWWRHRCINGSWKRLEVVVGRWLLAQSPLWVQPQPGRSRSVLAFMTCFVPYAVISVPNSFSTSKVSTETPACRPACKFQESAS